jgi:RHS repeat-associated protein
MHKKPDLPCDNQLTVSKQTTISRKGHQGVNRLTPSCHSRWKKYRTKYTYDAAGNLIYRTNNAFIQTNLFNSLNELLTNRMGGTLTVTGTTTSPATNVTVNTSNAVLYADATFAAAGFTAGGSNSFTAIAEDSYGRTSTNTVTLTVPVTANHFYDLNGNLLSEVSGAGVTNRQFTYDDENELTSVMVASNWQSQFFYDGKLRRRIEKDYSWSGGGWVETNEIHFIYDGNVVIQERDMNNNVLVTYDRGLDLSGSLQGAGGIGGLLARTDAQGAVFYHSDALGNVTALADRYQTLEARYLYDPYGNILGQWWPLADASRYRFSSKEFHPLSGLYYFGARFYDPNLQRWLNQDPIGEPGGINLYRYVANNPNDNDDPLGLDPGYGNPVSGPSGPIGPSSPYAPGQYYPNGPFYCPGSGPSIWGPLLNFLIQHGSIDVTLTGGIPGSSVGGFANFQLNDNGIYFQYGTGAGLALGATGTMNLNFSPNLGYIPPVTFTAGGGNGVGGSVSVTGGSPGAISVGVGGGYLGGVSITASPPTAPILIYKFK